MDRGLGDSFRLLFSPDPTEKRARGPGWEQGGNGLAERSEVDEQDSLGEGALGSGPELRAGFTGEDSGEGVLGRNWLNKGSEMMGRERIYVAIFSPPASSSSLGWWTWGMGYWT